VTPIARLTGEFEVIVVPSSSPHRPLGDLVAAFKAQPEAVSWGNRPWRHGVLPVVLKKVE